MSNPVLYLFAWPHKESHHLRFRAPVLTSPFSPTYASVSYLLRLLLILQSLSLPHPFFNIWSYFPSDCFDFFMTLVPLPYPFLAEFP